MIAAVLAAAVLVQDPDPVKDALDAFDKTITAFAAREEKFTLGAAGQLLGQAFRLGQPLEQGGKPGKAAAVYEGAADRVSKAISALESKPPDLRRLQGQIEKGRRRAAAIADETAKARAMRFALERAHLVFRAEADLAVHLTNLGIDYLREGALDEAAEAFLEAEEKQPQLKFSAPEESPQGPRVATFFLCRVRLLKGDLKTAAADLRRGLEAMPEWLDKDYDFKNLHAQPEDHAKLLKNLEEKSAGGHGDALLLWAHEQFFSEHRDKAKPILEKAAKAAPGDKAVERFLKKLEE